MPFTASAVVVMTDGTLVVYDPNETYVAEGVLGPAPAGRISSFSIGWTYTNPTYSNYVALTAVPDDLIGYLLWDLTAGMDASGLLFDGGYLLAGESDVAVLGGFPTASEENPRTMWFSMVAPDMPTSIAFGPNVNNSLLTTPVPEPASVFLMLAGLGMVGFMVKRRKFATVGV